MNNRIFHHITVSIPIAWFSTYYFISLTILTSPATSHHCHVKSTLNDGNSGVESWISRVAVIDKYTPIFKYEYPIGSLLQYTAPNDPHRILVGRLIARPYDRVKSRDKMTSVKIPAGHAWIEQDENSEKYGDVKEDSNQLGPIPLGLVKGKILALPFDSNMSATPQLTTDQFSRVLFRGI